MFFIAELFEQVKVSSSEAESSSNSDHLRKTESLLVEKDHILAKLKQVISTLRKQLRGV